MIHLLKIEWMKIKPYRTFWNLLTVFIASIFGVNFLVYNFTHKNLNAKDAQLLIGSPYSFPNVWQNVTYVSGFLLFLPGLLMITLITNEYSFRTHRQNIIEGITRTKFIQVKYILLLVLSVIFTFSVMTCAITFGLLSGSTFTFSQFYYVGYFFLQCLSYCSVALLFGFLLKKTGLAIGLYFAYVIMIERTISGMLNMATENLYLGNYLPITSADRLILFPFAKEISKQFVSATNLPALISMVIIYLTAYYIFVLTKFRKQDL